MAVPEIYSQLKYLAQPDSDEIRRVGFMLSNVKGKLLDDDLHFHIDELTCLRYLRMKGGNKEKALKRLEETIAWRANVKPHRITKEDVAEQLSVGDVTISDGMTRNGAGLAFARAHEPLQPEDVEKQRIFQMWYCEEFMRRGFRELCCVADFNMERTPTGDEMKAQKQIDDMDERHYPLFCSKTLLLNMPTFLRAVLAVYTAFWSEHQKAALETKVRIDELDKWIDVSLIPAGFAQKKDPSSKPSK